MESANPEQAAVPTEVYRLDGSGMEVTYRRARGRLTFATDDGPLAGLSGSYAATSVTDSESGIRVEADVFFDVTPTPTRRIMLTLLVPALSSELREGERVKIDGAAIITREIFFVYDPGTYPRQEYDARQLEGTVALEE